nr:flagellar filament capping protein FliD [Halalkalibacter oceani]
MATGMDIEQIVKDLMRAERMPVNKMMQDRQTIQWKMEDYREINRKLDTFRNNTFDSVIRQSNMLAKIVTSSNESKVTATAAANPGNVSLRISNIQQLAKAASYNSTDKISGGESKVNPTATLGSQTFAGEAAEGEAKFEWQSGIVHRENVRQSTASDTVDLGKENIVNPEDMVVKVNGKVYDVVLNGEDLNENSVLLDAESGTLRFEEPLAAGTTVQTVYMTDNETEEFTLETGRATFQVQKGGLDAASLSITAGSTTYSGADIITDPEEWGDGQEGKVFVNLDTGQIRFNEEQTDVSVTYAQSYATAGISAYNEKGEEVRDKFVFTANQSLNTVFTELSRSQVGVNGFYDEHSDKVNMTRTETGVFNENGDEMTFTGFFASALKLDGTQESGAQNAVFELNGLETERRSNTFTVSGMTITLKDTAPDEEITLGVSTDTDKVFDTIKGFIDEYNELIDFVNGKMTEERYRDYKPLTDEEKEALSEKEIEQWEERARSGLLRNDQALRTPFDQMRVDMYSSVSGELATQFNHLSAIGITTTNDYMARGKLEIDEDKLRAAIESDAEGVFQLFAADGDSFEEKGIARRVRDTLDGAISSLAERAGGFRGLVQNHQFTLGRNLNDINDRISNFERRLQQVEERYWRQFNAMEAAVQRANQQAESLFAQLYGNQGQ